tara:strand:+ start:132 stop:476 length:345 start_codon:yes stop_codon:yes gene_type:complete
VLTSYENKTINNADVSAIRSLLSTIAASMITLTCIAFSKAIVALTLASSQLGPRLMRNVIKDRTTQVVLGVFISNFLCGIGASIMTATQTDKNPTRTIKVFGFKSHYYPGKAQL